MQGQSARRAIAIYVINADWELRLGTRNAH